MLSVFLFVLCDVLGLSLVLPIMPYMVEELSSGQDSARWVGYMYASNALAQLFAAPLLGLWSDRHGRKPALLLCLCGTLISFIWMSMATSLWSLLLSRIFDGLLGGNVSLAHSIVADVTRGREQRARGMGIVGAAFGVGFTFGPLVGVLLMRFAAVSESAIRVPALASAALCLLNLIFVVVRFDETNPSVLKRKMHCDNDVGGGDDNNLGDDGGNWLAAAAEPLRSMWRALGDPMLAPLLYVRFAFAAMMTLFETTLALSAKRRFDGVEPRHANALFVCVGVFFSLSQGFGAARLTRLARSERALLGCLFGALAAALAAVAFAPSYALLVGCVAALSLVLGLLNALLNAAISQVAQRHDHTGSTLGLSSSIGCLTRVVVPTLSSSLVAASGPSSPFLAGALFCALPTLYIALAKRITSP
jgi:MFS transporter, DHA1 family, tetracycline resistance protein